MGNQEEQDEQDVQDEMFRELMAENEFLKSELQKMDSLVRDAAVELGRNVDPLVEALLLKKTRRQRNPNSVLGAADWMRNFREMNEESQIKVVRTWTLRLVQFSKPMDFLRWINSLSIVSLSEYAEAIHYCVREIHETEGDIEWKM